MLSTNDSWNLFSSWHNWTLGKKLPMSQPLTNKRCLDWISRTQGKGLPKLAKTGEDGSKNFSTSENGLSVMLGLSQKLIASTLQMRLWVIAQVANFSVIYCLLGFCLITLPAYSSNIISLLRPSMGLKIT